MFMQQKTSDNSNSLHNQKYSSHFQIYFGLGVSPEIKKPENFPQKGFYILMTNNILCYQWME
jgi:hypothetical protein